jgi:hypothetical protein
MTTKRFLCQCWLQDMNYSEFEAFALVEITPERARKLVELANGIKAPVLWLAVDDATPEWYRDVDLDELEMVVLDMDDVYLLDDGRVALVETAEKLDATGVYCEVTPEGVTWAAILEDDEEKATTAQFPLNLLVRIAEEG